jgi:ubiquinone biosynthesis accessory factor UbiJ
MRWSDVGEAPARLANRFLADQGWAREKLAPMTGRVFSIAVGPLSSAWSIAEGGVLAAAPRGAAPDLTLTLSPLSVPAFLAEPARWSDLVHEEGDAELGGVLKELSRTGPWFVEETFAKAFGPIAGQRLADAGRRLLAFPEYAAQKFAESAGSYARDEAALLARGVDARRWRDEIDEVAARVDALAQRIEALSPRVRPIR